MDRLSWKVVSDTASVSITYTIDVSRLMSYERYLEDGESDREKEERWQARCERQFATLIRRIAKGREKELTISGPDYEWDSQNPSHGTAYYDYLVKGPVGLIKKLAKTFWGSEYYADWVRYDNA